MSAESKQALINPQFEDMLAATPTPEANYSINPQGDLILQYDGQVYNASHYFVLWSGGAPSDEIMDNLKAYILSYDPLNLKAYVARDPESEKAKKLVYRYYKLNNWFICIQNLLRGFPVGTELDSTYFNFIVAITVLFKISVFEDFAAIKPQATPPLLRHMKLPPQVLAQFEIAASTGYFFETNTPWGFGSSDFLTPKYINCLQGNVKLLLSGKAILLGCEEYVLPAGRWTFSERSVNPSNGNITLQASLEPVQSADKFYQFFLRRAFEFFQQHYDFPYDPEYSQPYTHEGHSVARPNHDMSHAIRILFNVSRVAKLFAEFAKDRGLKAFCQSLVEQPDNVVNRKSDALIVLEVLALAVSVGRKDELSRGTHPDR